MKRDLILYGIIAIFASFPIFCAGALLGLWTGEPRLFVSGIVISFCLSVAGVIAVMLGEDM